MKPVFAPVLVVTLAALVLTSGCSSFRSDARAARKKGAAVEGVEGLWVGRWHEENNPRHGGRLQCVLTRTGETTYRAATRSQWWKIFTAAYDGTVVLTPVEPGAYLVQGDKDLWLFGNYAITGRVDGSRFQATYTIGKSHRGVMDLTRPE